MRHVRDLLEKRPVQQNVEGNEGGWENPQREMRVDPCQGEKEGLGLRLKESLGQSRLSDDLPIP